jgi:SecD/SecF fusion protein
MGLDIQGGIRLRYSLNTSELKKEATTTKDQATDTKSSEEISNVTAIRNRIMKILESRANGLGATEATVQAKGTSEIIVEIPGIINTEDARAVLGTTASLEYYHAKNVKTDKADYLPYEEVERDDTSKDMSIKFMDRKGDEFDYKDPRYAEMIKGWDLILKGDDLAEAYAEQGAQGIIPGLRFSSSGAKKMGAWTRKFRDSHAKLAAVLDGKVISIAPLAEGAIITKQGVIQGKFEGKYVSQLVDLLNSGALPVSLKEESLQKVAPTIGQHALDKMVVAGIGAFCVIAVFMLSYYLFPGIIAVIALILYTLFTLSVLKWFTTFSLAGIAAFVLSVGMAVDANILVFERVKEELRLGKTLKVAIDLGFKRALTAIVDSNACTIITSLVLMWFGTGPVKGFASTLIISVLISLFTAITVTRSLLVFLVSTGMGNNPKWFGLNRQWFGKMEKDAHHRPLQIVNKCGRYFVISLATIIPGVIFTFLGGIKQNVEFQGGYEIDINTKGKQVSSNDIIAKLTANQLPGSNVKLLGDGEVASITVPPAKFLKQDEKGAMNKIAEAAGFTSADVEGYNVVGPTVQAETIKNAYMGVIVSAILIVLYLAIRFGVAVGGFVMGLRFSISAIGAMLHDILVVLGLAAIVGYFFGWEISSLFITAVLTMIGFSTHDTIVIFDRIRENLRRPHPGETFDNLVNRSITQSFARSINTSGTVIVTLLILMVFGSATPELRFFNLAMLIGIISGTYSSIYNASPILYLWDKQIGKKNLEKTLMEISAKEMLHVHPVSSVSSEVKETKKTDDKATAYGTVKRRRASSVEKSHQNIDDV